MLDITPTKLLIVLVFGLIILGPDKLPRVARQVGEAWSNLKGMRQRMEDEMKGIFPQLPSTTEIASAVRSPLSLLDRLAASHETYKAAEGKAAENKDTGADYSLETDTDRSADTGSSIDIGSNTYTGADAALDTADDQSGISRDGSKPDAVTEEPDPAREVVRSVYGLSRSRDHTTDTATQTASTAPNHRTPDRQDGSAYPEAATLYLPPDDPTFN